MDTVIMGNRRLYDIMKEKDALYAKAGLLPRRTATRAAELEGGVRRAERLGRRDRGRPHPVRAWACPPDLHYACRWADLDGREKVKVLLAQALFGQPDIILLDEPTNDLDIDIHRLAGGFPAGLPRHA